MFRHVNNKSNTIGYDGFIAYNNNNNDGENKRNTNNGIAIQK